MGYNAIRFVEEPMADLVIRNDRIVTQLNKIAQRENRSVEDVLASLLATYNLNSPVARGTLADLAKSTIQTNMRSKPTDTSAKSREILNSEYADYLKRRHDE
jgi:hypothetical protein